MRADVRAVQDLANGVGQMVEQKTIPWLQPWGYAQLGVGQLPQGYAQKWQ